MAKLEPIPLEDKVASVRKMVRDLQERYNDARLDESESGRSARASVAGQLRRLSHDLIHPDENLIEADIPISITGEPFKINDVPYQGHVIVPECVFQTLTHMIDLNRKVDLDRMRESGRTIDLGAIMQRARVIQADD
jgi:hypothetical protein